MIYLGLLLTVALQVGVLSMSVNYGCQRNHAHLYGGKLVVYPKAGLCYEFFTDTSLNYFDASATCRFYGGTLVSVTSKEIEDTLTKELRFNIRHYFHVWIGLHDRDFLAPNDGFYRWEDGSPLVYLHWSANRGPLYQRVRNQAEDCVAMDMFGLWHDYNCFENRDFFGGIRQTKLGFICQMPAALQAQPRAAVASTTTTRAALVGINLPPTKETFNSGDQAVSGIETHPSDTDDSGHSGGSMTIIGHLNVDADVDTREKTTAEATSPTVATTTMELTTEMAIDSATSTTPAVTNSVDDSNNSATTTDLIMNTTTAHIEEDRSEEDGDSCRTFDCSLQCGTTGFKMSGGCMLCECNE